MSKKTYEAIIDQLDKHQKFWGSGMTRRMTPEEAETKIKTGKIKEYNDSPKKFVHIHSTDGTIEKMTWGEWLKIKRNKKSNQK